METIIFNLSHGDPRVCARCLAVLPDWFGIPEANEAYALGGTERPMLIARQSSEAVGFLSYELLTPSTVEIYCMAVLPDHQHRGVGKALFALLLRTANNLGAQFLLVKTLGPSNPDSFYAMTRAFYMSLGFVPLAEIPEIWGPENPCLLRVRPVLPSDPHHQPL